jgi:hypothetical protein
VAAAGPGKTSLGDVTPGDLPETIGWIGTRFGAMVAIRDIREVAEEYRAVVDAAM